MTTDTNVGKQLEKHNLLAEQSISGRLALFLSLDFKSVNTFQELTKYFNIYCQISFLNWKEIYCISIIDIS
jgi:hypothetical protein